MKHITIDPTSKHPSEIARIKEKIRENEAKKRQYNSLCYDVDEEVAFKENVSKIRR